MSALGIRAVGSVPSQEIRTQPLSVSQILEICDKKEQQCHSY